MLIPKTNQKTVYFTIADAYISRPKMCLVTPELATVDSLQRIE